MKIVIPGGSGQVGTVLARAFHRVGHEVMVLSRRPANEPWRTVEWDGETLGEWVAEFEGADAIINLAGQSVNCRYNDQNRRIIKDSRVKSTKVVGNAIAQAWEAAALLVTGEHRHDLRAPLRRAERRSQRSDRRFRTKRAGHLAIQHRCRDFMGARAERIPHAEHAQGVNALSDRDES
jgi:nucleoside-diphosphate-sugar epimerase